MREIKNIVYSDNYVAFLDILGFREMVAARGNKRKIKKIFNIVKKWGNTLDDGEPLKKDPDATCNGQAKYKLSYYLMSDSIVVNIRSEASRALKKLIEACRNLQYEFYSLETPVLTRGAIAKGEYYTDDRIALGKAMVDAYNYQAKYNRYPRVIISNKLLEEIRNKDFSYYEDIMSLLHFQIQDHYNYIDTVKYLFSKGKSGGGEHLRFKKFIDDCISNYGPLSVREKYIWLYNECDLVKNGNRR